MSRETGPSVQDIGTDMGTETGAEKDKSYREEKRINGAHFVVEWDGGNESYVICFPDVDTTDRTEIPDEVLRISDKVEDAKQVLEKALQLAQIDLPTWESNDPDKDVLKEIEKFITAQNY